MILRKIVTTSQLASIMCTKGLLIYLEEPERREGIEGPYYEISPLD